MVGRIVRPKDGAHVQNSVLEGKRHVVEFIVREELFVLEFALKDGIQDVPSVLRTD